MIQHFTEHEELQRTSISSNDKYHTSADNDIMKGKKESEVPWNHL